MEGGGLFTAIGALLIAPLQWRRARAQKLRLLSPHELNLRRATQPLGAVAVVLAGVWLAGARDIGSALAPVFLNPSDTWLLDVVLGVTGLYGGALFVTGVCRCRGVRTDGMLPVRAFLKFTGGIGILVLLHPGQFVQLSLDDLGPVLLLLALNAAAAWCTVVGAARFLLLTLGSSNALGRINRHIGQTQVTMRSAQPRPWWKFW